METLVIKSVISKVAMYLINLGYKWLFKKVDKNNDKHLSEQEITDFVLLISQKAKAHLVKKNAHKLK